MTSFRNVDLNAEGKHLMNTLRFDGRVAIVTGGGGGLGGAAARALAERGAKVVVNDLGCDVPGHGSDPERAEAVAREIRSKGGAAIAHFGDIGAPGVAKQLLEFALKEFGRIDILVNNAMFERLEDFYKLDREDVQQHLDTGIHGVWELTAAAWPHLVAQDYGRIITTGSTALLGVNRALPYGLAKGAQVSFNRSMAQVARTSNKNIKSNLILPLGTSLMMSHPQYGPASDPANKDPAILAARAVRRRILTAEGVATTVVALAHESCPVSGEMYSCARGQVKRLFFGLSAGIEQADLTPEYLAEHWDDANRTDQWEDVGTRVSMDISAIVMERAKAIFGES
jgi:NAD(P)-dependent dehydrogenase (short-subunit alcohol dehydrogenase family)